MRKLLSLSCTVILVAGLWGCGKKSSPAPSTANVMFVNAATGTTAVSVKLNGAAVSNATNLGFETSSGYRSVAAGSDNIVFSVVGNGITSPLVSGSASFAVGSHYSVFTGGLFTSPSFVAITDDITAPGAGKAKVRFINLSSDNMNASCYIGNTRLDSNIAYQACTPFIEVNVTTDKVTMLNPAAPTVTAQLLNISFGAGKIYTVMLAGSSSGTGAAALALTIIGNN